MNIDTIFENLLKNGSKIDIEKLKKIKTDLQGYIKKDYSYEDISEIVSSEVKDRTEEFLYRNDDAVSCISTSIYLNPNFHINIQGGTLKRENSIKMNEDTLFDIASITKLYTALLIKRLKKLGILDISKQINELTDDFNLEGYTIDDIINMRGLIQTPKRLVEGRNSKEALEILKQIKVTDGDKSIYTYTDLGLIILAIILEDVFGMSYSDIVSKYLMEPLSLKATYHPTENLTGNGRGDNKPNDPKSVILDRPLGHAGIFTSSEDLVRLAKGIFDESYLSFDELKNLCINTSGKNKGIFGAFTHHPDGLADTYVPDEYSKYTFAFEGFTGSVSVFDLINKIHNNILVNAMYEGTLLKHPEFRKMMSLYQQFITDETLKLFTMDKCFQEKPSFVKKITI